MPRVSDAEAIMEVIRKMALRDWHMRLTIREADATREFVRTAHAELARLRPVVEAAKALADRASVRYGFVGGDAITSAGAEKLNALCAAVDALQHEESRGPR